MGGGSGIVGFALALVVPLSLSSSVAAVAGILDCCWSVAAGY